LRGAIADNVGMSLPRAIVPGRRYMITRRCSERRFFMRPDRETNNAFIYCLALAARKAGISIVCVGTLSNHYHAVVVDNHGRLPQFLEHFHKLYGKHQNALRGRWEAFWASEQTSVVELVKPEDVLAKMVYAIANPVTSHLVERVHHWPGVESLTAIDHNVPLTATKPIRFFDPENNDLPDVIDLHFRRAPGFERLSHVEYSKLLRDKVGEAEEKAAAERREKGIKLLGRRGVLQQHWNSHPGTREPRRGLSPRVACKNTWARVEALQRNQTFIDRYREARADHLAGREAIFPAGTWWLHRFAGVKCAELGATAPPS
jgi:putative transposase